MKKALTKDDVIIQIEDAEFEVHSDLIWRDCEDTDQVGDIWDGADFYTPAAPAEPAKTWDDVRALQRSMIVMWDDACEIHEREVAHTGTAEVDYTMTPTKYQEFLTYFQTIRVNDEASHATPDDAITALEALVPPTYPT